MDTTASDYFSQPLIAGNKTFEQVTEDACARLERGPTIWWWSGFLVSLCALALRVSLRAA